jgi:CheY-like chemotaxis protein
MNKTFFSMYELMKSEEIDARGAIRDLGRDGFIRYLEEFMERAPILCGALEKINSANIKISANKNTLNRNLNGLQDITIRIYALKLPYDIESLMAIAKREDFSQLDRILTNIIVSVRALLKLLADAAEGEVDVAAEARADENIDKLLDSPMPEITETSPKGILSADTFERLAVLIENSEKSAQEELTRLANLNFGEEANKFIRGLNISDKASAVKSCEEFAKRIKEMDVQKKVILAVDDLSDVLNTLKGVLNTDYAFYGVTNHNAAIKFLGTRVPDLIILDIEMPGVDGFALFSLIRKVERFNDIPIVFFSGNTSMEYVQHAIQLGAKGYIKKPIEPETLLAKVSEFIAP